MKIISRILVRLLLTWAATHILKQDTQTFACLSVNLCKFRQRGNVAFVCTCALSMQRLINIYIFVYIQYIFCRSTCASCHSAIKYIFVSYQSVFAVTTMQGVYARVNESAATHIHAKIFYLHFIVFSSQSLVF